MRVDLVRAAVLEVYGLAARDGWLADRALQKVLRRETRLYSTERRAVAETVYALLRRRGLLEHLLRSKLRDFDKLRPSEADSLLLAAVQVFDGLSPEEALSQQALPRGLLPGLRAVHDRQKLLATLGPKEHIEIEESLPAFLAEAMIRELGETEALELARALNTRAPLTLRANLLKGTREALLRRLTQEGAGASLGKLSPLALALDGRVNAFSLPAFTDGAFEIQDEGSQLIAALVQARPGQLVVDACAGAGGKTLSLAAAMENRGSLCALDVDQKRLAELKKRARRAGAFNIRIQGIPAEGDPCAELSTLIGQADRVLVDAPCSGTGALRRNPDARFRLNAAEIETHAARQREILGWTSKLPKPGGLLVYATCSILRTENEEVVEHFLASHPEYELVPVAELLGTPLAQKLGPSPYLKLFPHRHGTDGFFAAALRRK